MRKVLFTGMLFLVLHSCRNTNNHDRLKFESTNETDLSIFPVHKLQYFAQDSNEIIIGDRSLGNILRIQINEDKITIKDTVKMSLDDWLQNLCLKNNKYFLVYNDSVVSDSVYLIRPHDSTFYYRINALFYPLVTDETLYLENNCKPCLDYPSTCETYTPELSINLKNGEVKEFPAKIKLSEIGSTFMKADVYSSRAIVDGNHYYSFANSSKIFVYNPDSSVIESKDARSKHQKDDFFSCSEEDTSDYVSFLIQNQICSPLYSTLVYNSKHKLFFRLFNQEQDLFQSDNKLNKLQNRRNFIQVINKELEVVDEVEITSEHFSHFMFTFGDKLFLTNIIINESGNPYLSFIALVFFSLLFSCSNTTTRKPTIINYLDGKSIVLEDTTTVIVMGCVSCAAKPYDMLDSLLLSCAKQQCRMILIMTPVDPNIDNVIIAKIRLANSIHIITDTEDGIKNSGLYHKSPKLFIVTKEGEVLKKVVIK